MRSIQSHRVVRSNRAWLTELDRTRMRVSQWPQQFLDRMGGSLPVNYMCFDTETTGFSRSMDVILEWGHVLVRNCRVVDRINVIINWFEEGLVPADWFEEALIRVRRKMVLGGKQWRLTEDVIRAEGVRPSEALPFIYQMCRQVQTNNELFVAHNGLNYDATMLTAHFNDFAVGDFNWRPDDIFDTGAIIKASYMEKDAVPRADETLSTYFKRIIAKRVVGVRWGLESQEVTSLRLEEFGVDAKMLHTASNDALAVHAIMERLRSLQLNQMPVKAAATGVPVVGFTGVATAKISSAAPTIIAASSQQRRRGQRNR